MSDKDVATPPTQAKARPDEQSEMKRLRDQVQSLKAENERLYARLQKARSRGPLIGSTVPPTQAKARPTHRHVKSGHEVTLIAVGNAQCSTGPTNEMDSVVIYEHGGRFWVRRQSEFEDGRFEAIDTAATTTPSTPEEDHQS